MFHGINKPQNHKNRMVEVGRDLWRLSCTTSLLKQCHLQEVGQDHVQTTSEYLQEWRLHNPYGQPVKVLSHLHSEKVSPDVQMELHLFQFVPIASSPVTGHHWKEPGSVLFTPSLHFRNLHTLKRSLWAFASPDWTVAVLSAFPHTKFSATP